MILALLLLAVLASLQNPNPGTATAPPVQAPAPRPQFFAGTVTAISHDQITVSRTIVGHPPDTRTFQLTQKTRLNRNTCKTDAKVTVRYQRTPEGVNIALQVLVHTESKTLTAKKP